MLENARALIAEYDMLPPGSAVLCAVSGGADSMCLLHFLASLEGITVTAAHFNHRLRGEESDADEDFVRDVCARWGIPLTVGRGDVGAFSEREGLSIEEGARILRYAFLEQAAQVEGCTVIATAHNADDNAETVLFNLIRGSGLKGLGGIPPCRGKLVRPLLTTSRTEILAYLEKNRILHREDSTNADETYARNKLRRQVLPLLKELNPKAAEHINAAARQAAAVDAYLDREAKKAFVGLGTGPGWVSFPWETLRRAPSPLRPRLLLLLLDQMDVGRKDFGALHFDALLHLENERSIDLPQGVVARRERGRLFLSRRQALPGQEALTLGRPLSWGNYVLTLLDAPEGEGLSLSLPAGYSLTVGPCPPQGRLTLPGSNGARTVKRLCLDKGISLSERDGLPAFYVDGHLAAVWPLGVDAAFAPEHGNSWFIQIKYTHTEKDEET